MWLCQTMQNDSRNNKKNMLRFLLKQKLFQFQITIPRINHSSVVLRSPLLSLSLPLGTSVFLLSLLAPLCVCNTKCLQNFLGILFSKQVHLNAFSCFFRIPHVIRHCNSQVCWNWYLSSANLNEIWPTCD